MQPLLIPSHIWTDISMNFIVGLPKASKKTVSKVMVDCLLKATHFRASTHPFTPFSISQAFVDNIFKLHSIPTSIVSNRDPTFTNKFWQELFKPHGTQLNMNTTYHPWTDGQKKVVNNFLETYLRCFALKGGTRGHNGFPWLNGGTIPFMMELPKWHHMKQFMAKNPHLWHPMYQEHPSFM